MEAIACSSVQSSRRVVVLVDRSTAGLPALMRRLRRGGCAVVAARTAEEVEHRCGLGVVDLVVLPLSRSGGPGAAVLPLLAERHPDVVVIMLAASPTTHQVAVALSHGVVGMLTADADRQALVSVFERAWEERELRLMDRLLQAEALRQRQHRAERARRLDAALRGLTLRYHAASRLRGHGGGVVQARVDIVDGADTSLQDACDLAAELARLDELEAAVRRELARGLRAHPEWTDVFVDTAPVDLFDGLLAADSDVLAPLARCIILELPKDPQRWQGDDLALGVERLRGQGFRFCASELGLWGERSAHLIQLRPEFVRVSMHELRLCSGQTARLQYLQTLVLAAQRAGAQVFVDGAGGPGDLRLAREVGGDLVLEPSPLAVTEVAGDAPDRSVASC